MLLTYNIMLNAWPIQVIYFYLFGSMSQYLSRKVKQSSFIHTKSYGLRTVNFKPVGVYKWADYLRHI